MADQEEVRVYQLENSTEHCVALSLFEDISNSAEIRKLVMDGSIEAALIKPSMIEDLLQVVLAAHKALHLSKLQKMKTKTLHSEIIFNLSPTNNITDSFKKFGLAENDTSLLVAVISTGDPAEKIRAISQHVKGKQVPLSSINTLTDQQAIKKIKTSVATRKLGNMLSSIKQIVRYLYKCIMLDGSTKTNFSVGTVFSVSAWQERVVYKIQDCEVNVSFLAESVICRMATKDVL